MNLSMLLCCVLIVIFCGTGNASGNVEEVISAVAPWLTLIMKSGELEDISLEPHVAPGVIPMMVSSDVLDILPSDSPQIIHVSSNADCWLSQNDSISSLCLTSECNKTAEEILSNLDETVDPCDDFYRFACGGWTHRTLSENKSSITVLSEIRGDMEQKLRDLVEKKLTGSELEFIKMLKSFYNSCMDLDSIEKSGAEPLKKVLQSLGGWPVVEGNKWNGLNFDWVDTLKVFLQLGYNPNILMQLTLGSDDSNESINVIHMLGKLFTNEETKLKLLVLSAEHAISKESMQANERIDSGKAELDQAALNIPDQNYLVGGFNNFTAAYYELMVTSAKRLGADETTAKDELLKAFEFEATLANFSRSLKDFIKTLKEYGTYVAPKYNKYTVAQLQEEVPLIPWLKYFKSILNEEVFQNDTVIVENPAYIKKFASLITVTDKRVVANYMLWRVVLSSMYLLSKDWRDLDTNYFSLINEGLHLVTGTLPRSEQCLEYISTPELRFALNSYYVREYFREYNREAVFQLVKYIISEFSNMLDKIDWMDDQTKKHAKAKVKAIKSYIGYPEEFLNDTVVLQHYESLKITTESYFENKRRLEKWPRDGSLSKFRKPIIRSKFKKNTLPATVNAWYNANENSIEFPVGILQNAFFKAGIPQYMNFGAIGHIIGHEISHAFVGKGSKYDKDGKYFKWWSNVTEECFKAKAQCIIDRYSKYMSENGTRVNGSYTLEENIADNGGLKSSYLAYQTWVKENGEEPRLPCLKYTQNQMFWISAASVSCGKLSIKAMEHRIKSKAHSPPPFRVIGAMSNLQEFAKDFNCSPDSPMNKKDKCQVW